MADSKITSLPVGAPLTGSDTFVIARGGSNFKVSGLDINNFVSVGGFDIDALPAGTPVSTDLLPFSDQDDAQTDKKATIAQIVAAAGGTGGIMALSVYEGGVDFTAGSTTSLALPVDPVLEQNLFVFFNGLFQESTEWTLTTGISPSVDFTVAIPTGVTRVEVRVYQP